MLNVLRLAVALLFASALMSRCASMMTPTGGPRDSLPPVIVNMTPEAPTSERTIRCTPADSATASCANSWCTR